MILADLIGERPAIAAQREQVVRLIGRRAAAARLPACSSTAGPGTGKDLLARVRADYGGPPRRLAEDARRMLRTCAWPATAAHQGLAPHPAQPLRGLSSRQLVASG